MAEIADNPSVVEHHPGTVGIEDPDNSHVNGPGPGIIHRQCFPSPLAFVIAGSQTDRIHIPEIVFRLRMDKGISVHFRCGGDDDPGSRLPRQLENLIGSPDRRPECLDGIGLIMHRGGGTRKMENAVETSGDRIRYVLFQKVTDGSRSGTQIFPRPGPEIIQHIDFVPFPDQPLNKMGANEPGSARDEERSQFTF